MIDDYTNLTGCEYPADLPRYRFVATQIRGSFEDEADIVEEVVPWVRFLVEPYGET